jgi:enoyl-CoA hydratase
MELTQQGRVLVVKISEPPYNYVTHRVQRDLLSLVAAVNADPGIGAVVVTGGIEGRYLLHFDLGEVEETVSSAPTVKRPLATALVKVARAVAAGGGGSLLANSPLSGVNTLLGFHETALGILRSPAVWIAAVNGPCAGAGMEVSVFFDIRLAARNAASFSMPELSIALNPPLGGQRLAQLMNPSRAIEFMLEARFYDAKEAFETGLVNHVVDDDELMSTALTLATRYSSRPAGHVKAQKRILNESNSWSVKQSLAREAGTQMAAASSRLFRRTVRRWLEMREETLDRSTGDEVGESVFLTNPQSWIDGSAIDMNASDANRTDQ